MKTTTRRTAVLFSLLVATLAVALWRSSSPGGPLSGLQKPLPGQEHQAGQVQEVLTAGDYTYFELRPEAGEPRWMVSTTPVAPGQQVAVRVFGTSPRFHSRRLSRAFTGLAFVSVVQP